MQHKGEHPFSPSSIPMSYSLASRVNSVFSYLRNVLVRYFSIDVRSLAALRISLSLIMIGQLLSYLPLADEFFSDQGVLPNELHRQLLDSIGFESAWTLYSASGQVWFVRFLMTVHLIFALALLFGFWTRIATFACLVLVWSLQMRNPWITTGGDVMLRCLLAWCLFLPWGYTWSLDARLAGRHSEAPHDVAGIATVGIMLQVVFMYWFAGIAKLNDDWLSGEALRGALHLKMYVKPLGNWVATWPAAILQLLTWGTLILELAAPLLLFSPRRTNYWRGITCGFFLSLHLGVWLMMSIGIFSLVGITSWLIFVPHETWGGKYFFDSGPTKRQSTARDQAVALPRRLFTAGMLAYMILINVMMVSPNYFERWGFRGWHALGCATMFVQEFRMFARSPRWSPELQYQGTTAAGESIDLFAAARGIPETVSLYRRNYSQPWRRYHWNLVEAACRADNHSHPVLDKVKDRLLAYHIEHWNARSVLPLTSAELKCLLHPIMSRPADSTQADELILSQLQPH